MPRPQKYGEPTRSVTVRVPLSILQELPEPWSDSVVAALDVFVAERIARDQPTDPESVIAVAEPGAPASPSHCTHPKASRKSYGYMTRCTNCGAKL